VPLAVQGAGGGDGGARLWGTGVPLAAQDIGVAGHGAGLGGTPERAAPEQAAQPVLVAQSSREAATLNLRIAQLEEQVRVLTGQVEGLQFQLAQMQTLLERMQEDTDARFSAVEGGGRGKTDAAPGSGGAMPSGGLPQLQGEAPQQDILIDPAAEGFELGEPERPLGTLRLDEVPLTFEQPLDLRPGQGDIASRADADAQYRAGHDAVMRGDYDFAEDQFFQFIALYPEHPQAPDATNWLGEALIQRQAFEEAADVLLTGFERYPDSSRAPDMLLKLGIALTGAGEYETACRTFGEIRRRYDGLSPAFLSRLDEEMAGARC